MYSRRARDESRKKFQESIQAQFGQGEASTRSTRRGSSSNAGGDSMSQGLPPTPPSHHLGTPPVGSTAYDDAPELRDDDDSFPDGISMDMLGDTCTSVRCNPHKPKRVPGSTEAVRKTKYGNLEKVKSIVQRTRKKIDVEYDDFIRGPRKSEINSLLVHAIGSILRSKVSVKARKWDDLPESERRKLVVHLSAYFNIDWSEERVWNWFHDKAADIFKDFKGDFHRHYQAGGLEDVPCELVNRREEWEWLCANFEEPELKARMKEKKEELRMQQSQQYPDTPVEELPALEWSSNLEVLEAGVGRRRGKQVRGLGKLGYREDGDSSRGGGEAVIQ